MTENIPELREAVASALQEITECESEVEGCITTWRAEFAAAVEPAMLDQARKYFEKFPAVATTLDTDSAKGLKATVRANAARVTKSTSERITLESIGAAQGTARFRLELLGHVAKATEESLRPPFTWQGWVVDHQHASLPQAHFNDLEELDAFQNLDKALNRLAAARAQHRKLRERLERAEALDLWDSLEG